MAMIRINRFGGIAPIMDAQKLPEPFGTLAFECLFDGGNIKPVAGKETLAITYGFQTYNRRSLFRLTDVQWLRWNGDVAAVKGPTPIVADYLSLGDDYRIYYAGAWNDDASTVVQWPQFTSRWRAVDNIDPSSYFDRPVYTYPLGVPAPQSVPTATASAAPFGIVTTIRATNPAQCECVAAHGLATGQRVRLSGLPGSGDGSELEGAQYAITVVDDTKFKLDSVDATEWTAGVPDGPPVDRTGLSATWTRVYADSEVEDRIYVYTYINAFGEEGMPSSPSSIATVGDGQTVDVGYDSATTITPSGAPAFQVAKARIYRTVSGSDSAQYLFVAEVDLSNPTPTYNDNVSVENLGEVLSTETYALPPSKLQGIVLHPNGFLVGFYGNTLCMSEPYLPYAWPTRYRKVLGANIVGVEIYGQTIVVVTDAEPQVGGATDPESLTLRAIEQVYPGTSRQGICSTGQSVVYISPVGLVTVDGNGARVVTKQYFSKSQWAEYTLCEVPDLYPSTLVYQDGRVWMGIQGYRVASFDMHDDGRIDVVSYSISPMTMFVDRKTDSLFIMDYHESVEANRRLHKFNYIGTARSYTWTSRRFHMPHEINMGAIQVFAISYGAGIRVELNSNENSKTQTVVVTSQAPVRLESGFLSRDWRVTIFGTSEVQGIHLAESIQELRDAAL